MELIAKKQNEMELDIRKELQETKARLEQVLTESLQPKLVQSRAEDEERIRKLQGELEDVQRQVARQRQDFDGDMAQTKRQLQSQLDDLERERDALRREQRKLESELQCTVEENNQLKVLSATN